MSPEARAEAWLKEQCIYKPHLYVECLASAIRAAENEALERAAAMLDKANNLCGDHDGICPFCAQRRRDARVIRGLKSKPPEGK